MIDYHIHTSHGWDAKHSMEEMVAQAIKRGLTEIAFTEHVDPAFEDGVPVGGFKWDIDFGKYLVELNGLREKYAGKIRLVFGVELSVEPASKAVTEAFIKKWPFEFVIGSVHDVNGKDLYYHETYAGKTKRQAYEEYFETMKRAAESVDFHVLGHLDYIERNHIPTQYAPYEDKTIVYEEYAELIDGVLRAVISGGKGIECNTSGGDKFMNRGPNDVAHPRFKILKRYRELGGEIITIGSDAHVPQSVGQNYSQARRVLLEAGFKAVTVFRDGKPVFVDL